MTNAIEEIPNPPNPVPMYGNGVDRPLTADEKAARLSEDVKAGRVLAPKCSCGWTGDALAAAGAGCPACGERIGAKAKKAARLSEDVKAGRVLAPKCSCGWTGDALAAAGAGCPACGERIGAKAKRR